MATRSFAALPPEAAEVLRPVLPGLAEETIEAIAHEVPDYARAMEGAFGRAVRGGVVVAFNRFVDLVVDGDADLRSARRTYVELGRGEFRAGRSLDALLAAYRVGARLAWRRFVEAGKDGGLDADVLYDLGEAIFAYIDELSAESAEGFAEAQSAAAGENQERRRRLVRLLAEDPPAPEEAVRAAAHSAGWALPRRLAAIAAGIPGAEPDEADALGARLARSAGSGAVGGAATWGQACVFVPDPDAPKRRRQLETALAGEPVALGPSVTWPHAAASLRRAAAALRLRADGRVEGDGLLVADEHLVTLVISADPVLAAELAATRLAPLAELGDAQRERLSTTLRAWLDRPGQVQAVAGELDVHPQTVRYRLGQLRELFGERLEDPEARFELSMALRVTSPGS